MRPRDDAEAIELALIENMAREDLNPIEEARACAALVEELGLTREEVGRRVGRSRVAVSNLMRLLDLPDEVIELLEQRRAQRGPRPRAAARRRPRRAHEPGALGGARGLVGAHGRSAGARRRTTPAARRARASRDAGRGEAELHPDQEHALREIAETLGAALGAEVSVKATAPAATARSSRFDTAEEAIELARRLRPRAIPGLLEHSR